MSWRPSRLYLRLGDRTSRFAYSGYEGLRIGLLSSPRLMTAKRDFRNGVLDELPANRK